MLQRLLAIFLVAGAALTLAGCDKSSSSSPSTSAPVEVKLEAVTFSKLEEEIAEKKGSIVVVDAWFVDCVPCKKSFPHLVELHKTHAKDGVVCMSVTVDLAKDHERALQFLKDKGATFPNYRLEDPKTINEKWNFNGCPAVTVYDRKGKPTYFNNNDPDKGYTYDDVTKKVNELLAEK
jgi:thiol-disulfide isomerase/thioredoxin